MAEDLGVHEIEKKIKELGTWFHNMSLNGVQTAPDHFLGDYPNVKWREFQNAIPADLTGLSVLDIGCNAGFYAIEMKKRGAARVVGIDHAEDYLAQARFAASVLGADIDFRKLSVYEIGTLQERFDIVIYMGVSYHLRHPLLALDLIRQSVANDWLVFQSLQRGSRSKPRIEEDYPFWQTNIFDQPGYPKMHFVENCYANDPTNWWVPNASCVEALLRSSGFKVVDRPEAEVYICRCDESAEMHALPEGWQWSKQ